MELTLTPRLRMIAACVPEGARLADVGTDHGYLPVWLLLEGRIPCAIASDLRRGPLERARETARRYGVEGSVSFRLCNGLSGIGPDETDAVSVAGLGGETIASVLEAAPWTREKRLLLQPMTHGEVLRGWLAGHGYRIEGENLAKEGKHMYCVLEVCGGAMPPLSPAELWAGRNSKDPLRREWLDYVSAKLERALGGQLASAEPDGAAVERYRRILAGIGRMREEM